MDAEALRPAHVPAVVQELLSYAAASCTAGGDEADEERYCRSYSPDEVSHYYYTPARTPPPALPSAEHQQDCTSSVCGGPSEAPDNLQQHQQQQDAQPDNELADYSHMKLHAGEAEGHGHGQGSSVAELPETPAAALAAGALGQHMGLYATDSWLASSGSSGSGGWGSTGAPASGSPRIPALDHGRSDTIDRAAAGVNAAHGRGSGSCVALALCFEGALGSSSLGAVAAEACSEPPSAMPDGWELVDELGAPAGARRAGGWTAAASGMPSRADSPRTSCRAAGDAECTLLMLSTPTAPGRTPGGAAMRVKGAGAHGGAVSGAQLALHSEDGGTAHNCRA